jgi:hypothetical protein
LSRFLHVKWLEPAVPVLEPSATVHMDYESCMVRSAWKKSLHSRTAFWFNASMGRRSFFLFLVGWDWVSWYCGHYWPIVPAPDDGWWWLWRNLWNDDWQGIAKYSEKTCPSATLSTTNLTWLDPGLNPGRRGGKPATNRLSHGAAIARRRYFVCKLAICLLFGFIYRARSFTIVPPSIPQQLNLTIHAFLTREMKCIMELGNRRRVCK